MIEVSVSKKGRYPVLVIKCGSETAEVTMGDIAQAINWDIAGAAAISYDLLEEVNFHPAARALKAACQKEGFQPL